MNKYITYGLLAVAVISGSCVKEVPLVSGVYVEPKPVFFMFINPDSTLYASYSKVTSITEPHATVDNALISLYRNDIPQGDMTPLGSGKYTLSGNQFQPRDSIRIYASDGLYSFFIRGRVPSIIYIDKVDTQTLLIAGVGPAFTMDVTFADSAIDDNFYRLSLKRNYYRYTVENNLRTDSTLIAESINISGSELPFIQNNFNNYSSREILFSDETFNGTQSKFRIYTPVNVRESLQERTVEISVILENMEKPLFDYFNTRNAHLWQQQSISQLPGTVLGNVGPGYGVGGAYTSAQKTIYIK